MLDFARCFLGPKHVCHGTSERPGVILHSQIPCSRAQPTHYTWAAKTAGFPVEGGFDVCTEFVPNQRITDTSSSSLEGTWTYLFEPEGSGTKLTVEKRGRSFWRIPPLERLLDGWRRRRTIRVCSAEGDTGGVRAFVPSARRPLSRLQCVRLSSSEGSHHATTFNGAARPRLAPVVHDLRLRGRSSAEWLCGGRRA